MPTRDDKARKQIEARIYRDTTGEPPDRIWRTLVALISERGFAVNLVRKYLSLPTPVNTTDRTVLEQQIFPHYRQDPAIRTVLFVGCTAYTAHYQRKFFPNVNFVTLEPDPAEQKFGATPRHIVAPLEQLANYCEPESFDLIICNGVFGWGLDGLPQCEAAFDQCYRCLTENGHLLLGWNDVPRRTPIALESITSLKRFRKYGFPAFESWRYLTETPYRHTFDFYQK